MELAATAWGVISAAIIFVLGAAFFIKISRYFDTKPKRALGLYVWHTLFCVAYALFALNNPADANFYFAAAKEQQIDFELGTEAIMLFTSLVTNGLGLEFLGAFLVFNVIGCVGLLAYDASLQKAVSARSKKIRMAATVIVLLPSVSFWSSAIGKDAVAFTAVGLALWAALRPGGRSLPMATAVVLMLVVRPHVAILMVMAVAGSSCLQKGISVMQRMVVGTLAAGAAVAFIPLVSDFTGMGTVFDVAEVSDYIDRRQVGTMQGGSAVDISSMSLPEQLFAYLFRPLPHEAHNWFALASSIDNLLLLILVVAGVWAIVRRRRALIHSNRAFLWIYSLSAWVVLAVNTANLGISVRQKWMFLPILVFLLISVIGRPARRTPNHARPMGDVASAIPLK